MTDFHCFRCETDFESNFDLNKHIKEKGKNELLRCPKCNSLKVKPKTPSLMEFPKRMLDILKKEPKKIIRTIEARANGELKHGNAPFMIIENKPLFDKHLTKLSLRKIDNNKLQELKEVRPDKETDLDANYDTVYEFIYKKTTQKHSKNS